MQVERGTVVACNSTRQKIAVAVDGDHCAIFELTADYDVDTGHRLRGNLESDLCFSLENLTTGEMMSVIPMGAHVTQNEAKSAVET